MTAVDVDALDKLREAATFDGWRYDPLSPCVVRDGHPRLPAALISFRDPGATAELIVAAVNALPDLIAEVRRGRALREAVEGLAESTVYGVSLPGSDKILPVVPVKQIRALLAAVDGGGQS